MNNIRRIILHEDTESTEFVIGCFAAGWGLFLLLPFNTFASAPTAFRAMEQTAAEWAWGAVLLSVGLLKLIGLYTGRLTLRRLGGVLVTGLWGFITVMVVRSNPLSTGIVVYGLLTIFSGWTVWRMGLEWKAVHRFPFIRLGRSPMKVARNHEGRGH